MGTSENVEYYNEAIRLKNLVFKNPEMLPSSYYFLVENTCNLACPGCHSDTTKHAKRNGVLTTDDWANITEQLPDYASVCVSGGEPLIYKGFKEVLKTVSKKFRSSIITNGILLNEECIDFLLEQENFKLLSISISDIGNHFRTFNEKQWYNLGNAISYFNKKNLETNRDVVLDLKTLITDENTDDLFEIHRHCVEKYHSTTHTLMLMMYVRGRNIWTVADAFKKYPVEPYKNWDKIVSQLEKIRVYQQTNPKTKCFITPKVADFRSPHPIHHSDMEYLNNSNHEIKKFKACDYPWATLSIHSNGNIMIPCLPIRIGNIIDQPLKEALKNEAFLDFKNKLLKAGTLPGCNRCCKLESKANNHTLGESLISPLSTIALS